MTTESTVNILPDIPDAESIRQRLAVVTTEASLLRAQLRVSKRLERERERLRALVQKEGEEEAALTSHEASRCGQTVCLRS
jgi:hypothetical protein